MKGYSEPKSYRDNSSAADGYNRYAAGSVRGLAPSHCPARWDFYWCCCCFSEQVVIKLLSEGHNFERIILREFLASVCKNLKVCTEVLSNANAKLTFDDIECDISIENILALRKDSKLI